MPTDLSYVLVLFGLFVVPKVLQRFRIPGALTSMALGALVAFGGLFAGDPTISLMATFGIASLFLFAGMEIDFADLNRELRIVIQHLVIRSAMLVMGTLVVAEVFELDLRPAALVALALLTPSTGFILDSLASFGLREEEQFWVKSKAIAAEFLALGTLFIVLQSTSVTQFSVATLAMVALIIVIPLFFQVFAEKIAPFAPRSEFAFLLMVAVVCAVITKKLGVYYLVGAFLVGIAAQRFRQRMAAMSSEQMLHAVEAFASVFIPFYFFQAGLLLERDQFSLKAIGIGLAFVVLLVPLRIGVVALHRRFILGEPLEHGARIGLALVPTLVFSLVLATILREEFEISPSLFGGLIVYTVINTALPSILLRAAPLEFETVHLHEPSGDGALHHLGEATGRPSEADDAAAVDGDSAPAAEPS